MSIINQREVALFALMEVTENGGYNNIVLRKTLAQNGAMSGLDKSFVTEVVNGCLRNLIYLDYVINQYSKTKTVKMKPFILNLLRVGVYQILFMDKVPDSAAVNESVKLAKKRSFATLAPFVNGVLRQIARKKDEIVVPNEKTQPLEHLHVKYSYPMWLIEYWLKEMDYQTVSNIIYANSLKPKVTICVNTLKTDKQTLIQALQAENITVAESELLENALLLSHISDFQELETFKQGHFHVMDQGAMFAVKCLNLEAGKTVLDLCAAPGGKTFLAAYEMGNSGSIVSNDVFPHKLKLLEETAERLSLTNIETNEHDATKFNKKWESFADYVILDAPCSGLGLIRKKADIKFTKTIEDVHTLVKLQRQLLENAAQYLKPNGVLLYCTCTISKAENLDNVLWFCEKFQFEIENIGDLFNNVLQLKENANGTVQLLPNLYDGDGFFVAKLRRR